MARGGHGLTTRPAPLVAHHRVPVPRAATTASGASQILLVEDEPANRALVRAILGRTANGRFQLREAETLEGARMAIREHRPDIVLLDIRLPDGNGLDLVAELRSGRPAVDPFVVVMSASVLPGERAAALAAGVDAFVGKPYQAATLLAELERAMGPTGAVP